MLFLPTSTALEAKETPWQGASSVQSPQMKAGLWTGQESILWGSQGTGKVQLLLQSFPSNNTGSLLHKGKRRLLSNPNPPNLVSQKDLDLDLNLLSYHFTQAMQHSLRQETCTFVPGLPPAHLAVKAFISDPRLGACKARGPQSRASSFQLTRSLTPQGRNICSGR